MRWRRSFMRLAIDRSKLAAELDDVAARAKQLETANRDVAERIDAVMETIRSVVDAQER